MSRELPESVLLSLEDDVIYPFFAVELKFDGDKVLRLWTGVGTLNHEGQEWVGTGNLLDIETVEETTEIAVKGATLTLSGIPTEVISLALTEPYQGRVCNIYFGSFVSGKVLLESSSFIQLEDGSKIILEDNSTNFTEIFSGYMDQMNILESADNSTVELKVENKLIDLERQRIARYTSSYQKSIYPNDKGLDFIEDLQDKEVLWGRSVS